VTGSFFPVIEAAAGAAERRKTEKASGREGGRKRGKEGEAVPPNPFARVSDKGKGKLEG